MKFKSALNVMLKFIVAVIPMKFKSALNVMLKSAVAVTALGSLPAFAAVDTGELDAAKADAIAVCAIVFGILVAIAAYKYVKRAL